MDWQDRLGLAELDAADLAVMHASHGMTCLAIIAPIQTPMAVQIK